VTVCVWQEGGGSGAGSGEESAASKEEEARLQAQREAAIREAMDRQMEDFISFDEVGRWSLGRALEAIDLMAGYGRELWAAEDQWRDSPYEGRGAYRWCVVLVRSRMSRLRARAARARRRR
jgi:hypothetical protein